MSKFIDDMFIDVRDKSSQEVGLQSLMEMVEQVMDATTFLNEREMLQKGEEKGEYFLPTIRITEAWGQPGTKDREIIEQFTKTIGGDTLQAKIASINAVINDADDQAAIPQILSSMVVIEILNAILADFTESAGGFIFEGFLAGLFGGEAIQVTDVGDETGEATGKPITDVVLGGREYSLKLLGQTTGVKGSFRNMVEHFRSGRDHVVYLDARRTGTGLLFGEFEITLDNFLQVFYEPFKKIARDQVDPDSQGIPATELQARIDAIGADNVTIIQLAKPRRNYSLQQIQQMDPEQLAQAQVNFIKYNKDADYDKQSAKIQKLFGDAKSFDDFKRVYFARKQGKASDEELLKFMTTLDGYVNREQFEFTRNQAESIANFQEVGELDINPETLKRTWLNYGEILKESVEPIYRSLNDFTNNINLFFLTDQEGGDHKQSGLAAASDAKQLQVNTDKAVKSINKA
tara:strand:+ start:3181 stop:4563 length:1383 start_codon:yes stop_codon:yes gene_type:complete